MKEVFEAIAWHDGRMVELVEQRVSRQGGKTVRRWYASTHEGFIDIQLGDVPVEFYILPDDETLRAMGWTLYKDKELQ